MHIPDGYLSPSTCAVLYAAAAGGWRLAFKRVKQRLFTRAVPLISVFAAFSFVLMMFNLPLPGGTTGHAVGAAIAAIVIGPWGAILAISIALALQALFFGDGGITTLGANCVNMAMVGSLAAYWAYRLLSGASRWDSRRRVWAAAVAGYVSINAAALLAAIEFGIQPLLFHDAKGVPLYAPYPLRIAIPAMMLGHLTLAGLAEAVIAGGMVSYLQRAKPALLHLGFAEGNGVPGAPAFGALGRNGVPGAPAFGALGRNGVPGAPAFGALGRNGEALPGGGIRVTVSLCSFWFAIALLLLLTPLGILAAGTAWGEWSPAELARRSGLSQGVPSGMQRLTALWTAPFPGYAPAFVKSAAFGYLLSAMFGVGAIVMLWLLSSYLSRSLAERAPRP
jgi:cobalt/nickel transport system permease protein